MRLMQSVSAAISMTSLVFALQASSQAAEPVKPMYSDHPASVQSQSSDTSTKKTELKSMKAAGDTMAKAVDAGYWTCTMHPEIHKGEPGNCPKCGMKLVLKKSDMDTTRITSVDQSKMEMKSTKMAGETVAKTADAGYWTCPMHSQIHKPTSGQCPICSMNLVFKKDGKIPQK